MAFPAHDVRIEVEYACVTTGQDTEVRLGAESLFVVEPNGPEPEDRYPQVWARVQCPVCGQEHGVRLTEW